MSLNGGEVPVVGGDQHDVVLAARGRNEHVGGERARRLRAHDSFPSDERGKHPTRLNVRRIGRRDDALTLSILIEERIHCVDVLRSGRAGPELHCNHTRDDDVAAGHPQKLSERHELVSVS